MSKESEAELLAKINELEEWYQMHPQMPRKIGEKKGHRIQNLMLIGRPIFALIFFEIFIPYFTSLFKLDVLK